MKLKYILLLILLSINNSSYSSEFHPFQKETMVSRGLKGADIIFYGELIKVDTILGTYDFRVIELFKGKYKRETIRATNNKEDFFTHPFKKDLWIVYAKFNKDQTISISLRSPTQTLEFPAGFPPPIPYYNAYGRKITKIDSLRTDIENLQESNKTLTTFFYQLEKLRIYKSDQNTISQKEKADLKIITYVKYILISLVVTILLLLVSIFLVLKKKKPKNIT